MHQIASNCISHIECSIKEIISSGILEHVHQVTWQWQIKELGIWDRKWHTSVTRICLPGFSSDSSWSESSTTAYANKSYIVDPMDCCGLLFVNYYNTGSIPDCSCVIYSSTRQSEAHTCCTSSSSSSAREALDSLMMLLILVLKLASWSPSPLSQSKQLLYTTHRKTTTRKNISKSKASKYEMHGPFELFKVGGPRFSARQPARSFDFWRPLPPAIRPRFLLAPNFSTCFIQTWTMYLN